jgi:RimJ/RimL family protein N-acetyltransferase
MELRDITMEDLPLYERMLTDAEVMAELGGPLPREGLRDKLGEIVEGVERGDTWYSVIVPDEGGPGAGTVCIWEHEDRGERLQEIGWMLVPEHQGRGLATAAVRAILDRARADRRWSAIHAFPGLTNGASNAICRKTGFTHVGEADVQYAGRTLRCNHWRLDLAE